MKKEYTVLVVDDEEKILELLRSYLEIRGYRALCARTGEEGLRFFKRETVSLILLDLMLPDCSGEDFCRQVRIVSEVPIIMITARVDEESIIRGLHIGADDYVCKPFSPRQLMARVEAVCRRSERQGGGDGRNQETSLVYEDLILDRERRILSRNGVILNLTRDEYAILCLLMSRQTKIFTRDEILMAVKGEDYDGFDRTIDTHIKNLRAKLGDDPKTPQYIVTVYGMGYRFGGERLGTVL